jgi:hypothetical protein
VKVIEHYCTTTTAAKYRGQHVGDHGDDDYDAWPKILQLARPNSSRGTVWYPSFTLKSKSSFVVVASSFICLQKNVHS